MYPVIEMKLIREKGDSRRELRRLNSELPAFILKYGYFGEGLSPYQLVNKWMEVYGNGKTDKKKVHQA